MEDRFCRFSRRGNGKYMTTMEYHNPVLLQASVDGLNIKPDGVYVDVTFWWSIQKIDELGQTRTVCFQR
jgi:hypothetical protein